MPLPTEVIQLFGRSPPSLDQRSVAPVVLPINNCVPSFKNFAAEKLEKLGKNRLL
jgi:hypothetical protein